MPKFAHLLKFPFLLGFLFLFAFSFQASAQSVNAIINSLEIDTLINSGSKDNRINFAVQNRGHVNPAANFNGRADFVQLMQDGLYRVFSLGDSLEKPPYAQYRDFFNLYAVWWPNATHDGNGWNYDTLKGVIDGLWLPWADTTNGWATMLTTIKYGGGGGAGLNREKRVGDGKLYGMGWSTFLHEFGHTMPGQIDEYSADGSWSGGQCWESGNSTAQLNLDDIPWRKWIDPSTPLPTPYTGPYLNTIGVFEGSLTNFFGCYRATARSCIMGAGGFGEGYGDQCCPVCVQRIICFMYQYVDVIENPIPAQTNLTVSGAQTMTFKADVLHPTPNTQKYQWLLNGIEIATGVDSIDVTFGACDSYELTFVVLDTNTLIRYDEKFEDIYPKPIETHTWTIDQSSVGSYNLTSTATGQAPDCSGADNGEVSFAIAGGLAPYQVVQDGQVIANPAAGLSDDDYEFYVVDANGCGVAQTATVPEATLLKPLLCSTHNGSTWAIEVTDDEYPSTSLVYSWSTGATTQSVSGLADGTYTVDVTTPSGCTVSDTITLVASALPLSVTATSIPSDADGATGKIYLDVSGGVAPYSVIWYDNPDLDLTDDNPANINASGTTWGHLPSMAYDDDVNSKWLHHMAPTTAWNSYEFTGGAEIHGYSITFGDDVPGRDPKDWEFQGSMNGTTWTTLDTRTNVAIASRYERRAYPINNQVSYAHYRFNVLANQGANSVQLQELEYIGTDPNAVLTENTNAANQFSRTDLAPGTYVYIVTDANQTCFHDTIRIGLDESFTATGLTVVKNGNCGVRIDQPNPLYTYYWFDDQEATNLLGTGSNFVPLATGNYYVGALDLATGGLSANRKGFAVTVAMMPDSLLLGTDSVFVYNPEPDVQYYWYDIDQCGTPLDSGAYFLPGAAPGNYYAASRSTKVYPAPIDPAILNSIVMHMDASDMDGDNQVDDPQLESGSLYDWTFRLGPNWTNDWFAYRGNAQNGLGIADFGTIWLQGMDNSWSNFQSVLMVYKENALSFPETAPMERLSNVMPKHPDSTQLFAASTPASTLNGKTFLNGEVVNPLTTPNPMNFSVLGLVPTQANTGSSRYTDPRWEGQLAELILYSGALTDAEMEGASEYMRKKWISTAELESPRNCFFWNGTISSASPPLMNDEDYGLVLQPNPASSAQWVSFVVPAEERVELILIDQLGRQLYAQPFDSGNHKLEISSLLDGKGIYYAVLKGTRGWQASVRVLRL